MHVSRLEFKVSGDLDVLANFNLYDTLYTLLDQFSLEHEIMVTSANPNFSIPAIKSMLRLKNCPTGVRRTDESPPCLDFECIDKLTVLSIMLITL